MWSKTLLKPIQCLSVGLSACPSVSEITLTCMEQPSWNLVGLCGLWTATRARSGIILGCGLRVSNIFERDEQKLFSQKLVSTFQKWFSFLYWVEYRDVTTQNVCPKNWNRFRVLRTYPTEESRLQTHPIPISAQIGLIITYNYILEIYPNSTKPTHHNLLSRILYTIRRSRYRS